MEDIEKKLKDANNCLATQGTEGNWNANDYMLGMFNGMELIISILEGREPEYRDLRSKESEEK